MLKTCDSRIRIALGGSRPTNNSAVGACKQITVLIFVRVVSMFKAAVMSMSSAATDKAAASALGSWLLGAARFRHLDAVVGRDRWG